MAEGCCPDCGRPFAADGCPGCHRSKSGTWPVSTTLLGAGKGGPGLKRVGGKHGVRRFQLSFKLDETLAGQIKDAATERGQTLGQVIRDLIADGFRYRRRNGRDDLTAERRAEIRALSEPGDYVRPPADRPLRPVIPGVGAFER